MARRAGGHFAVVADGRWVHDGSNRSAPSFAQTMNGMMAGSRTNAIHRAWWMELQPQASPTPWLSEARTPRHGQRATPADPVSGRYSPIMQNSGCWGLASTHSRHEGSAEAAAAQQLMFVLHSGACAMATSPAAHRPAGRGTRLGARPHVTACLHGIEGPTSRHPPQWGQNMHTHIVPCHASQAHCAALEPSPACQATPPQLLRVCHADNVRNAAPTPG